MTTPEQKAAEDQGPRTDSAGIEIISTSIATQAPAAPAQQQAANGAVTITSTTTQPTNAESFAAPGSVTVPVSAPVLPGPQSPIAAGQVPPATGTQITSAVAGAAISPGQSEAALSYIYKATTVTSTFERGRFTQELEGVLLIFPEPPRPTVYRDSDDNLAYEYTADDNLGFDTRPGSLTPITPSVLTGPVVQAPNSQNLAQIPESSTGEPAPIPVTTDTIAPGQSTAADSGGQNVSVRPSPSVATPDTVSPNPGTSQNMAREN